MSFQVTNIEVQQGDITTFRSDVIVNAANSSLLGGGGVDGAIHRAAGTDLLAECRLLGGCKTGQAKITNAHAIVSAKKIVHTVGPVYKGHKPEKAAELLASCYKESLALGKDYTSITFPSISTGIYGYPIKDASVVAVKAIREWIEENPDSKLETVTLIAFSEADAQILREAVNIK